MNTRLSLIIISLFLVTACSPSATGNREEQDHNMDTGVNMDMHDHDAIELADHEELPQVVMEAKKDPIGGWNIQLATKYFRFAPEHASQENVPGEGHAHLYVDGEKVMRIYSNWVHLNDLSPGDHVLKVSLNANDHSPLYHDGAEIASATTITQE